jgi:tetratricopeptide (TPR) repeat protein
MAKTYVGKSRADNLHWLLNTWLADGPPVCFLQGFPGVGKSDLARDLRAAAERTAKWQHAVINEIVDRPTPQVIESLMELSVALSNQGLPEMEKILFGESKPNLGFAMEKALERPVLIILDEAQRFFQPDTGSPLPEMNAILAFLRNRPNLRGRLLLLSDRIVEKARWSEWIPKRSLEKLEPDEAVQVLESKLNESDIDIDIPVERRKEVVRDLDFNPRAIEALAGALRSETLDEIIESNPGLWAVRDREVSREFLTALERDLLQRTMSHLEPLHLKTLNWLAVHRRSFKRQALEKLCKNSVEATQVKNVLLVRYLANFHLGDFSLNSLVREISLAHLRDEPSEFRQAHSRAADYHLRHFKAKQIVVERSRLGESFAELRYHLTQAGRQAEIREMGHRFTDHLKQQIKSGTAVPRDPEELDERIGVLTVLLENGGAKGLEFHLARCLQARAKAGDLDQAVMHAERAVGSRSPEENWYLLAKLTAQSKGAEPGVVAIHRGLHDLREATSLYLLGAEILASADRYPEAIKLLQDGIEIISPEKNLYTLYHSCADMLAKSGKTDKAVALLQHGIKILPPENNLSALYQSCAELLAKTSTTEAVALLLEGIKIIPAENNLFALYQSCAELLAKTSTTEAVALLQDGIKIIPPEKNLVMLFQKLRDIYCQTNDEAAALLCLQDGIVRLTDRDERSSLVDDYLLLLLAINRDDVLSGIAAAESPDLVGPRGRRFAEILLKESREDWPTVDVLTAHALNESAKNNTLWDRKAHSLLSQGLLDLAAEAASHIARTPAGPWISCFIDLRRGRDDAALRSLASILGREPMPHELNEDLLLAIWDERVPILNGHLVCSYFPVLSSTITGRSGPIRKTRFGPPVLTAASEAIEIYVSYAWGEDASPEGRRREEIVDRLCQAVRTAGHKIGRDKERMSAGDSIERFAQEISRARRIIAVISEKSLHSDFCMAHELFRAYRRCDYQRQEFQEKVIALVMDDARPWLADETSVLALGERWKEKFEKLHASLLSLDPNRKNEDLWVFVGLVEEMVTRLPGMLTALKDIVMKRGFDDIVADRFREVLRRLSPA